MAGPCSRLPTPGWAPWLTCPPRPTPGAKAPRATRTWSPTQKRSKHLPALRLPGQQHRCPTWLLAPLGRTCSAPWPDRTRATRTAARLRAPADAAPWSSFRESSALRARSAVRTPPGPGLQRLFVGAARGPSAWPRVRRACGPAGFVRHCLRFTWERASPESRGTYGWWSAPGVRLPPWGALSAGEGASTALAGAAHLGVAGAPCSAAPSAGKGTPRVRRRERALAPSRWAQKET